MAFGSSPKTPKKERNKESKKAPLLNSVPGSFCMKWDSLYLKSEHGSILQNASGDVNFGEIVVFVSNPYSSAHALLHILANFVHADRGRVSRDPSVRLRDTTLVWNYDPDKTLFNLNVKDSIATYVIKCWPSDGDEEDRNLLVGVALMAMINQRDKSTDELSRCEAKYLLLLLTLAVPHKLILLDEPFEGLRYKQMVSILKVLVQLKARGHAVVIATSVHPEIAMKHADKVHLFSPTGQVTYSGAAKTFLDSIDTSHKTRTLEDLIHLRGKQGAATRDQGSRAAESDSADLLDVDIPDNQDPVSNAMGEVIFKTVTDDDAILCYRVLTNAAFMFALTSLSKKRAELTDAERPLYNMNVYFIFHVFLAIQSFYFGYQVTLRFSNVVRYEYFNCNYLLASSAICSLSAIHTLIEVLCTTALSVFVFLVTDQQQLYISSSWKSSVGQQPMTAWSPFLFVLSALVNSFNFGRLGFYAGILKVNEDSFKGKLNQLFYLGIGIMIISVVSCRFSDLRETSKIDTPHKVIAYISPLSRLQEMTFFSVYGTREDIYCETRTPDGDERSCRLFHSLVDGKEDSLLLLPLWASSVSLLLLLMFFLRIIATIMFAMKLYQHRMIMKLKAPSNRQSSGRSTASTVNHVPSVLESSLT